MSITRRHRASQGTHPDAVYFRLTADLTITLGRAALPQGCAATDMHPDPQWQPGKGGFTGENGSRHFVSWAGKGYPLIPEYLENL